MDRRAKTIMGNQTPLRGMLFPPKIKKTNQNLLLRNKNPILSIIHGRFPKLMCPRDSRIL
jgi:hypothetical protein